LGSTQLSALLTRTGFNIDKFEAIDVPIEMPGVDGQDPVKLNEKYFCIVATKQRPLDIK
jgi:hypothetical protein